MQELLRTAVHIIDDKCKEKEHLLVAIDGRCASGKSTLSRLLQDYFGCNVIHMDHFFLREEQRSEQRLNTPGENVDYERFLEEVMKPLREGSAFSYRPYQCNIQQLGEPITIVPKKITVIEGSYACHTALWEYYDLRLFLTVSPTEQLRRITVRAGREKAEVFRDKWIPLEEQYFKAFRIEERCDYRFTT